MRKRGLNKTTRELLHTSNGKLLAKDVLEACMLRTYALSQLYDPLARDDNERVRVDPKTGAEEPAGDAKQFLEFAEATARFAKWLAPYQSPKLSAIAIKEAPSELQEETTFTVNIFNERGAQVAKIVDGEVVEENFEEEDFADKPPRQLESPRQTVMEVHAPPAEAGDISDVVHTSLQEARADDPQAPRYQPHVEGIAPPRIKPGR